MLIIYSNTLHAYIHYMYLYITCIHTLHVYIHYNYTYIHVHQFPVMKHHAFTLVVPAVNHVYAENLLIYRLVKLKNNFSLHYPLVDDKLNNGTHSLVGFGRYIAKVIIDKYSYQCLNNTCLPCGRL